MGFTRRAAITGIIASLSGCVGILGPKSTPTPSPTPEDSDYDGVPDSEDDYPKDPLRVEKIREFEKEAKLEPDSYEAFQFEVDRGVYILEYDVIVQGDAGIDAFVMDRENYVKYINGDTITYLTEHSLLNIGSGVSEDFIDEGNYVLVLDYTNYETDMRRNSVTVKISFELSRTPE